MTFIRTLIILFVSKNYKLKYLFAMKAFKTSYTSYMQIVSQRFTPVRDKILFIKSW